MIDHEIFIQRMALLADRIGRKLAGPTQLEYYAILTAELTTEQFIAAMALAFRSCEGEFRNWPSPQQLIEFVTPVAAPTLSAHEAFDRVLEIAGRHPAHADFGKRLEDIQALGATTVRAFRAGGGFREFSSVLLPDLPFLRKRFVELYEAACANADAERAANLALASASEQVRSIVSSTANALPSMPAKRIAAGGGR